MTEKNFKLKVWSFERLCVYVCVCSSTASLHSKITFIKLHSVRDFKGTILTASNFHTRNSKEENEVSHAEMKMHKL